MAKDHPQPPDHPDNGEGPTNIPVLAPVLLSKTMFTEAELREADPLLQVWMLADETFRLCLYDTLHHNGGTYLTGDIEGYDERRWQRLHQCFIAGQLSLYDLPDGRCAHAFLQIRTQLWIDVRERQCNWKRLYILLHASSAKKHN